MHTLRVPTLVTPLFYSASNFLGITIKSDVAFAGAKFYGPAHFAGGEFQAGAYFYRARFKSTANFDGCLFHGSADYVDSSYRHVASFQDSTFRGNTDFDGATFQGNSHFRKVRFEGEVDFSVADFLYVDRPCGTQFRGKPTSAGPSSVHVPCSIRTGSKCRRPLRVLRSLAAATGVGRPDGTKSR
jgi:hypothetical protein